jgi:D-tagatose-1,6-bisphosphate aldolase subunit GatZ/KbaZ
VRDHFAIVKIGPGATFALREALWGLAEIEREWLGDGDGSQLKDVVLGVMRARPQHWQKYYGDPDRLRLDLQFSLSDRIRYYWAQPEVREACARMLHRLGDGPLPLTLLSQYLPLQYAAVRDGALANSVGALLHEGVGQVLRQYVAACVPSAAEPDVVLQ